MTPVSVYLDVLNNYLDAEAREDESAMAALADLLDDALGEMEEYLFWRDYQPE